MSDGIVRRHVDARLISYALSVLKENEIIPELRMTFHGCAAGALQAASGMVALVVACRSAANSPAFDQRLDARQREHVRSLLNGLGATIETAWVQELKEVLELIVVLAAETSATSEDEMRFRQWAQGVFLDTRPLLLVEDDVTADVEDTTEPEAKRHRVRKARSSRDTYQRERLENLITRAIAMGVLVTKPVLAGGQVFVVGTGARRTEEKLLKVRGSLREAEQLCKEANEEIRKMHLNEAYP
jgi:hypothetical protein